MKDMTIINLNFSEFPLRLIIKADPEKNNDTWFVVEDISKIVGVSSYNLYAGLPLEDKLAVNLLISKKSKNRICISYNGLIKSLLRIGNKFSIALITFLQTEVKNLLTEKKDDFINNNNSHVSNATENNNETIKLENNNTFQVDVSSIPPANQSFNNSIHSIVENRIQAEQLLVIYTEDIFSLLGLVFQQQDDRYKLHLTNNQKYPVYYYPVKKQWTVENDSTVYKATDAIDFIIQAAQKSMQRLYNWMVQKNDEKITLYTNRIINDLKKLQDTAKEVREQEISFISQL